MTPSELHALEQAYEKDPEGTWYALHDAYLECEPPREREAARVRMKQRNGWRWQKRARDWLLGVRVNRFVAVAWLSMENRSLFYWGSNPSGFVDGKGYCDTLEAAKAAAEDWLLDHGY